MAYIRLFKEMWRYAGHDRWKIVLFVTLHVLSQIGTILTPLIFAQILNIVQENQPDLLRSILIWSAAWAGLWCWGTICHRAGRYLEFQLAYRIRQRFLNEYYGIIADLPMKWHTDHHSGDTINRINIAGDAVKNFTESQFMYIEYFTSFGGPLIGLALFSWKISILSLLISVITLLIINYYDKRLVKLYAIMNNMQHLVSSALYDYIGNIKTIVTLKLGLQTGKELDHRLEAGYPSYMLAECWVNGLKWFFVPLCEFAVTNGGILFYIISEIHARRPILAGNVTAIYQYSKGLAGAFGNIASYYQQIIHWDIAYQAVLPIKTALDPQIAEYAHAKSDAHSITIKSLNFSYGDSKTLDDLSFAFSPGEKIALVGESGSGKSSLMAILRGLYQPDSVALAIDGRPFDTLAPLAGITTLIPQEPEIFENTIRYNITFGVAHSDAEILDAVRLARFDIVLERLPNGLETDMRERGVTLSGGERQRLALARGILAASDSSIILLDEPTSSVDAYNEAIIYENLFATFSDRAIIASIHRLHLLNRFDRVIVMERGRIVQVGSFEDLKVQDGPFRALWEKTAG